MDCPLHVPADPCMHTKFTEKTFMEGSNAAKFATVFTCENFRLYGISCMHIYTIYYNQI